MKSRILLTAFFAVGLAALLTGLIACDSATDGIDELYYTDTVAWNGEYDVIVVGFGGAGATAATYAADAGARVLLTEKAPPEHAGGNTRYSAQLLSAVNNVEKGLAHYKALGGDNPAPDAVLRTYVEGLFDIYKGLDGTILKELGATVANDFETLFGQMGATAGMLRWLVPEYPEVENSDAIKPVFLGGASDFNATKPLWTLLRQNVLDRADKIDVWYNAPGKKLIQDPVTKTILGVQIEKQGKLVNIKAKNGVVLATGGFENNKQMRADYLSLAEAGVGGSLYNTGDGIKMAMEAGADLWHMDIWEGGFNVSGTTYYNPAYITEGAAQQQAPGGITSSVGGNILVNGNGERFVREEYFPRHGHVKINDSWHNPLYPEKMFLIFDSAQKTFFDYYPMPPPAESITTAGTIAELAGKIGAPNLERAVTSFNDYAQSSYDPFGRPAATMKSFAAAGPYYAMRLLPYMLNTQGGPRRNENAEVLDTSGNPIPHLYSAGELGGLTSDLYQGGSNLSECVVFGRIAGKNAAAPKSTVNKPFPIEDPEIIYTPGHDPDKTEEEEEEYELGPNEYLGVGSGGMGGDITVKIRMDGNTLAAVTILKHAETHPGIATPALENLPGAMVAANSWEVDKVSGATLTSNALKAAVKDALSKVPK
jgi:succinate dehydrogenase/fumarate reductase flavoprotein subunit